ncbi:MAG: hypothetical protein A7316_10305 [Candidatus Altiarchaeales archaeon WOR_SM1_86-2]|nr:MAG: hypothetical protein A7316_10305 [Candidatus Altiarchaeales archaeon WOR_SM1_86-2]
MNVTAILFDMDGVLIDSFESCYRTFNFTLEHFGAGKISRGEFTRECWGIPTGDDLEMYLKNGDVEKWSNFYHSAYPKFIEHSIIFPDTIEVLETVKDDFKTALVTNTYHELTIKILKYFRIRDYFDVVLGGDDVKKGKPDPEIIIKACGMLGVSPSNAILVGDTVSDMAAGKGAGCLRIGVGVDGDLRIERLGELLEIIKGDES